MKHMMTSFEIKSPISGHRSMAWASKFQVKSQMGNGTWQDLGAGAPVSPASMQRAA